MLQLFFIAILWFVSAPSQAQVTNGASNNGVTVSQQIIGTWKIRSADQAYQNTLMISPHGGFVRQEVFFSDHGNLTNELQGRYQLERRLFIENCQTNRLTNQILVLKSDRLIYKPFTSDRMLVFSRDKS